MQWINVKWAKQMDEGKASALVDFIELSRDQVVHLIKFYEKYRDGRRQV